MACPVEQARKPHQSTRCCDNVPLPDAGRPKRTSVGTRDSLLVSIIPELARTQTGRSALGHVPHVVRQAYSGDCARLAPTPKEDATLDPSALRPLALAPNPVYRFYGGGEGYTINGGWRCARTP